MNDRVVVCLSVEFGLAFFSEFDQPLDHRENRKIPSHLHAFSGKPARALLSDDDVAGDDGLSVEEFDPQAFRLRVTTVRG